MSTLEDDAKVRALRIDQILEELRLNTEDLHELAKQAVERAGRMVDDARARRRWWADERAKLHPLKKT